MPKGGHARSGPAKVEGSRTSDRAGYTMTALPPAGFDGKAPEFPLPLALERELTVWAEVWSYPQGHYWADRPNLWRHVAMYVRWSVRMEDGEASAALGNVVMRYADDAGISEAGMKLHGLKIADAPKPEATTGAAPANVTNIKNRLSRGTA